MLVVDLHALQPVDLLNLVHDVVRESAHSAQAKDVMRAGHSVDDFLAPLYVLAFEHQDVPPLRHEGLVRNTFLVGDDEALLALGVLAETDRAGDFGQHRGFLGFACLEKVCYPRKTTGDVPRHGRLLRHPGNDVSDPHLMVLLHDNHGARREHVVRGCVGAR